MPAHRQMTMAAVNERAASGALIFRTSSLKIPLDDQLADFDAQLLDLALALSRAIATAALERPALPMFSARAVAGEPSVFTMPSDSPIASKSCAKLVHRFGSRHVVTETIASGHWNLARPMQGKRWAYPHSRASHVARPVARPRRKRDYSMTASIRKGPLQAKPASRRRRNSRAVSARPASTPIPLASEHQSRRGSSSSSIRVAFRP
ncbi:hypothetical protein ACVWXN_006829 [Bradyrhizobium sp. i1.4.4]